MQLSSASNNEKEVSSPPIRDVIGPADPTSNIRRIRFAEPQNETKLHRRYRLLRQETLDWQHDFWSSHNTQFLKVNMKDFMFSAPSGGSSMSKII